MYVKEFVEHYIKLGIDKIFIYDDNDINTEKIIDAINNIYKKYVKIYENIKNKIEYQFDAYNDCYNNHKYEFDWFLMIDMDEFLIIKKKSIKKYLSYSKFNKCDFIKFHWIIPNDNNLVHYDNRSLFERFKGPYIKFPFIKSLIRGNINNLSYSIHSPSISPERNISCNNIGKIIKSEKINYEAVYPININQAYIIHYKFKSTEEYINKYKRGYNNWFGNGYKKWVNDSINTYFEYNKVTIEKLKYVEKELKINLSHYKENLMFL